MLFSGAPGRPVAPIEAIEIQREEVTLTWNTPEDDGGSSITHYLIEKRDVMRAHWSHAEKTTDDTCKAKVKNLTEGSEFYFRVMAVNKTATGLPLESKAIMVKSPFSEYILLFHIENQPKEQERGLISEL